MSGKIAEVLRKPATFRAFHRSDGAVRRLEAAWTTLPRMLTLLCIVLATPNFETLAQRYIQQLLDRVPAVVAAAKANLKAPPRVNTETAISQNKGTLALVQKQLEPLVKGAPALEPQFRAAQAKAVAALQEYQQWLEKDLLPRSTGDFRIGDEKFRHK